MTICNTCRWVISTDNKCGCWPLARPKPMAAEEVKKAGDLALAREASEPGKPAT